jgi:Zn-dependent M28 family amino/carboxypeptidase
MGVLFVGGLLLVTLLVTDMPGTSFQGPLPPLTQQQKVLKEHLDHHVFTLAGTIGERNIWHYEALEASAAYIGATLQAEGHQVTAQPFNVKGQQIRNLEMLIRGTTQPNKTVIVGAHYDSVLGSPGANDNATGVAALLEIARLLVNRNLVYSVRLVAFVNEEPPFFHTQNMGSRVYAKRARARGDRIVAMLSLETIGYYSDMEGTQQYPFPFGLFYPSTGNFIGFVGNIASRALVRRAIDSFRCRTPFPSEGTAAPGWLPGISWSDHWAFWREGYPAIMITDTAPFRYPQYHRPGDRPEMVDYERLARVVSGLAEVVIDLAGGEDGRTADAM